MSALWCVAWVLAAIPLTAQTAPQLFRVAGTVVESATGKPLNRIRLAVGPGLGRETASLVTRTDGRFHFSLPAGNHSLWAERKGFPPQQFGAASLDSMAGVGIVTGPDKRTDTLVFRLHPPSSVSGRIVDSAGEPVEGALIQLVNRSVVAGRRTTRPTGWAYSNDLGEYRFGYLAAGSYILAVTGSPWYADSDDDLSDAGADQPAISYAAVFYPGVTNPRAAVPIVLKAGQDFSADFTLTSVPGSAVSIRFKHTIPVTSLRVQLLAEALRGWNVFQRVITSSSMSARISSVPRGSYTLTVLRSDGMQYLGSMPVGVTSGNVQLEMELKPAPSLSGIVAGEGLDARALRGSFVVLHDEIEEMRFGRPVAGDGSFSFPAVRPGRYRVYLSGGVGVFADRITTGGVPVEDGAIQIGYDKIEGLTIHAVIGAGRVKGFVYRDAEPLAGAGVVLIPAKTTPDYTRYYGYTTDSDGSFDLENIRPGDYRLFVRDDPDLEYANPDAMKGYLTAGKLIRVEVNQTVEEKLEVQ
jgi:hypothetical protein